jgi:multidrug efflux pump subunit AcrB
LRRPRWAWMMLAAPIIAGALAYPRLPTGFMPHMDEGGFILDYVAAPGTSLAETDRLVRQMEALLLKLPELASYSRRTGLQLGGGLTESNEGDLFVRLKPDRSRDIEAIMHQVRVEIAEQVPGLQIETAQLMEDLIGDLIANPQPVEIKVFGFNQETRLRAAEAIAEGIAKIPGIVEVNSGARISGDAVQITLKRVAAAQLGLDAAQISAQLETLLAGSVQSQFQQAGQLIDVRLWTPRDGRARIEQLSALPLRANNGALVNLGNVANLAIISGQPQLVRDNLRDAVIVTARLEDRDLGSAMRDVQKVIAKMPAEAGVHVEYGGLYQEQKQAFRELGLVFVAAVLLLSLVLMFSYESIAVVLSILLITLAASAAVFVGLALSGSELNLSSMMGLTMVIGVIAEVAVFYFAEAKAYRSASIEQLAQAGVHRLRPIIMTASIAILTLLPLALGQSFGLNLGAGAAMQQPLAIAIISGLLAGAPLVLLALPALYAKLR